MSEKSFDSFVSSVRNIIGFIPICIYLTVPTTSKRISRRQLTSARPEVVHVSCHLPDRKSGGRQLTHTTHAACVTHSAGSCKTPVTTWTCLHTCRQKKKLKGTLSLNLSKCSVITRMPDVRVLLQWCKTIWKPLILMCQGHVHVHVNTVTKPL
jgi:hypothetical protein